MKKILLVVTAISVTLLLSSCVGLTNISTPQTVALNQGNFKFVKSVSAETEATYVFGIGGFKDRATADVVEKLREAAELQSNQALADIRIKSTTNCYLGIVVKRFLTATATVVEFCDIATNTFIERPIPEIIEEVIQVSQLDKDSIAIVNEQPLVEEQLIEEAEEIEVNSYIVKEKKEFSIEYSTQRLKEIKNYLLEGNIDNKEEIKEEVKNIRKWYYGISSSSSEMDNLLKEIKKQLKD